MRIIFVNPTERFDWGFVGALQYKGITTVVFRIESMTTFKNIPSLVEHVYINIDPDNLSKYMKVPVVKTDEDTGISILKRLCSSEDVVIIVPRSISRRIFSLDSKCLKILYFSPTPFYIIKALRKSYSEGSFKRLKDVLVGLGGIIYYYYKVNQYDIVLFRDPVSYKYAERIFNMRNIYLLPPIYVRISRMVKSKRDQMDETLSVKPMNPYILSVADIRSRSSDLYYIKYLNALAKHIKDVRFVIIGTSNKDLSNLDLKITLERNLHLAGYISDDDMLAYLYKNSIASIIPYILPGQSNRLMESLFYYSIPITGKLAVHYHFGIKNKFNAEIIDLENIPNVVSIIKNLARNEVYRETLRKNIRLSYNRYLTYVLKTLEYFISSLMV